MLDRDEAAALAWETFVGSQTPNDFMSYSPAGTSPEDAVESYLDELREGHDLDEVSDDEPLFADQPELWKGRDLRMLLAGYITDELKAASGEQATEEYAPTLSVELWESGGGVLYLKREDGRCRSGLEVVAGASMFAGDAQALSLGLDEGWAGIGHDSPPDEADGDAEPAAIRVAVWYPPSSATPGVRVVGRMGRAAEAYLGADAVNLVSENQA